MKPVHLLIPTLVICSFILAGCPVSSSYPLGERSTALSFESSLLGNWKNNNKEPEAKHVLIEKGNIANTYKVTVKEKGEMYMADSDVFTGWLTELEGSKFLVLQEMRGGASKETYFVYHLTIGKNDITTNDVTLKVGGTDAITSVTAYRDEVKASMKFSDFLQSPIVWKKQ